MAIIKTYMIRFDSAGNLVATKELDVEPDSLVVIVRAKNPTNANKAALATRGE
jgi:hypothetical protein